MPAVGGLGKMPPLVLSANDGLAPQTDVGKSCLSEGNKDVIRFHADTDHSAGLTGAFFARAKMIERLEELR